MRRRIRPMTRLTLSQKVTRLYARLKSPEWRLYGGTMLGGKLIGVGVVLLLMAGISGLLFTTVHAQSGTPEVKAADIVNPVNTAQGGNGIGSADGGNIGIPGAVVTTLAMCGPTSVLAFFVGRASQRFTGAAWHGALGRGLIPVMIGLTAASATVIVSVADYSWAAAAITLATAAIALFMRVHPLWAFAVAALLGLAGLV